MIEAIKEGWKKLPWWGKVLVVGGTAYGGRKAYKSFVAHSPNKKSLDYVGDVQTEAQKILKTNANLPPDLQTRASFTPAQMKGYAQTLFTAMDGAGTDEEAIHDVFSQLQNDLDVYLLIDAFGTRAGTSMFASSTPSDLATWLNDDGQTKAVNDILATKAKVTYRF
jgi:hypothetical protein